MPHRKECQDKPDVSLVSKRATRPHVSNEVHLAIRCLSNENTFFVSVKIQHTSRFHDARVPT